MKLKNTHRGSKVVIDSSIFTYHLSGHSIFGGACKNFLKRVERGEYESYVDDVVLSEVLLNFVKSELFRLRGIKPHRVVQEIKGEPNLIGLVNFDVVTLAFRKFEGGNSPIRV
jgi:predicted nucleic acid-binding protein